VRANPYRTPTAFLNLELPSCCGLDFRANSPPDSEK
jgi:hypothetical protein